MLRTPSHLTRACGQSHYKKFWLMQTQTDSQDNCVVPSPSVLSFPATTLKGSDGKIVGSPACSPTSWSSATEIAPQGRAAWPAVGSTDAGLGGMSNVHRSNVSLSTCAESLTLKRPDISSRLFHFPSEGGVCTGTLSADDENPGVVERTERSSLCASFSPCVLSSPDLVNLTHQVPNSGTSQEIGLSEVANRSEKNFALATPSGSVLDAEPVSTSVRDVTEDYNCSTGSDPFYREEPLSDVSAQGCALKPAYGSPSASTESKCPVLWNVSLSLNVGESSGQFKHHAAVEHPDDYFAGPPGLCVGRNVLRMCKLCGTTKTPLWRSGPQGPKSLCNACGIRFKKLKRSQAAGECAHMVVSSPSTALLTKFSARPLKRKSASEKEIEVMKVKSCQRTKRSKWPTLMTVRRNSFIRVEDTESCLTSPGTPSPRKQLSHVSRASLERNVSAAKLALLEKESATSALAADVKEAAILLMALSCGLVLA